MLIAFENFNASKGIIGSDWVGLKYFRKFFDSYYFERTVSNTIGLSLYELIASFPVPIILALALNSSLRRQFAKTVQFVIYMPHFISTVVMVGIILEFLNPRVGIVNLLLQGIGFEARDYLAVPELFKGIYVWSGIWQNAGWGTIIYLAALSAIDPELHEAATIDGAGRLQRAWLANDPYGQSVLRGRTTLCRFAVVGSLAGGVGRRPRSPGSWTLTTLSENALIKGADYFIFSCHRLPPGLSPQSLQRGYAGRAKRKVEALRTDAYPTHCRTLLHPSELAPDSFLNPNISSIHPSYTSPAAHIGSPSGRATLIPHVLVAVALYP